ncbi:FHA domain-containing protein [Streptomyces sp. NBC_00988]|uniref:FHA domain-containing protein n=1 Tax=Streptomyces sp. NBC_00988 TaxID=2903704 RepID=UPI00386C9107
MAAGTSAIRPRNFPGTPPRSSHRSGPRGQRGAGRSWSLIAKGSANGTTVNGADGPISPYVPVPLKHGDRVHVALWTTITLHRD